MTGLLAFATNLGARVAGPRRRPIRHGDDDANESVDRVEGEPADIERDTPAEDDVSEQRGEPDDASKPAPFEE